MSDRKSRKIDPEFFSSTLKTVNESDEDGGSLLDNLIDLDGCSDISVSDLPSESEEEESSSRTLAGNRNCDNRKRAISHESVSSVHHSSKRLREIQISIRNNNMGNINDDELFEREFMNDTLNKEKLELLFNKATTQDQRLVTIGDTTIRPILTDRMALEKLAISVKAVDHPNDNLKRANYDDAATFAEEWLAKIKVEMKCDKIDANFVACFPFHGVYVIICANVYTRSCLLSTLGKRQSVLVNGTEMVFSKFTMDDFERIIVVFCSNKTMNFRDVKTHIQRKFSAFTIPAAWKPIGHEGKLTARGTGAIADYAVTQAEIDGFREMQVHDSVRFQVNYRTSISIMFAKDRHPIVKIPEANCIEIATNLGAKYVPEREGALVSKEAQEGNIRIDPTRRSRSAERRTATAAAYMIRPSSLGAVKKY